MVVEKSNISHFYKTIIEKTLKLLRSDLASKEQGRVKSVKAICNWNTVPLMQHFNNNCCKVLHPHQIWFLPMVLTFICIRERGGGEGEDSNRGVVITHLNWGHWDTGESTTHSLPAAPFKGTVS